MATKLSGIGHIVLWVRNLEESKRFYVEQLGFAETMANRRVCFLRCSNMHHDIALAQLPKEELELPEAEQRAAKRGMLYHVAFRCNSFDDLLITYRELRSAGVQIKMVLDHGPTTSVYFDDPDGNEVEIYEDKYPLERWMDFIKEPRFADGKFLKTKYVGIEIDLEEEAAQRAAQREPIGVQGF